LFICIKPGLNVVLNGSDQTIVVQGMLKECEPRTLNLTDTEYNKLK